MNPTQFYKCLADDTRLRILLLILAEQELCVCELTAALDESQPKISRHLALLKKAGLLSDRRQGQWVYYQIAAIPSWQRQVLETTTEQEPGFIQPHLDNLADMGDRPERVSQCCT